MNCSLNLKKLVLASIFVLAGFVNHAFAVNVWWDNNGTAAATSGTWDTTSSKWATSSTLTASTFVFTNGNFPEFTAGSGGISAITITVNSAVTCAGMATGLSGTTVTNLTFSGTGSIAIASGLQGFYCGGSGSDGITINVPLTGTGEIQQHSSGYLALYATNTYSGGTAVTGGQLIYYNNNNSFGTGPIVIGASGNALVSSVAAALTITNAFQFPTAGYLLNLAGGNPVSGAPGTTFTGNFPLPSGNTTLESSSTATEVIEIAGTISGTGANLLVADNGTLELGGTNTYTGNTSIASPGALSIIGTGSLGSGSYAGNITNNSTFIFNSSTAQTFSGVISGTGTLNQQSGALTLSGVNTSTGTFLVNGGTMYLGAGGSLNSAGKISIAAGATFDVSAVDPYTIGSTTTLAASGTGTSAGTTAAVINDSGASAINLGSQPISLTFAPAAFTGDVTHPALLVTASGGLTVNGNLISVNNTGGTALGIGTYRLIQVGDGSTGVVTGTVNSLVTVTGSGMASGLEAYAKADGTNVNLVVQVPAQSPVWNGNDFATSLNWSDGLNWAATTPPDLYGDAVTFDGSQGLGPVMDQSYTNLSITFNSTAGSFVLTAAGANYLTLGGGVADNATAGQTINMPVVLANLGTPGASQWSVAAGGSLTNLGVISDGGQGLAVSGAGTLVMGAASTYTGATTLAGGTVQLAASETAGTSGPLGKSAAAHAGNIAFAGGTLQYTGVNQNDYSGRFSTAASQPISIDVNGQPVTLGTVIAGAGTTLALKDSVGGGVLSLSAAETYTGGTTINPGATLTVSGAGKLTAAGNILNNGTLNYNSTSAETLTGIISGSGTLTQNGTNTLTLSGSNTYSGITTINGASLVISNDANLGTPPASFVSNQLTLNNSVGAGANYGLRDTGGNMTLNPNRGIYLGSSGGSINAQNGFTFVVGGVITGPGAFYASPSSSAGYGTIVLSNANTYAGATVVGAGTLTMAASGVLPYGTPLTISSSQQGAANGSFFNMATFSQTIGPLASVTGIGGVGTGVPTIQNVGTLTILETNVNTTFAGVISGTGGNVIVTNPPGGTAKVLTLTGTNTYTGSTTIANGATLALSTKGAISNSANIYLTAGGTFDVSALTTAFSLSASTTFNASGVGTNAATLKGNTTVNFNSRPIVLTYTPSATNGDASNPALNISAGTLSLNGNAFTVNNASGNALNAGTYTLIQQASGNITSAGTYSVNVTGSGLASGATASIQVTGGTVNMVVKAGPTYSNLTPSQSIGVGTATVTLSGTLSAPGPLYPANGETVTVTINGNAQTTTISDSTGDFTVNYNSSSLPVSGTPYAISYGYAGDATFTGVTNSATTLTVSTLNQTITFGTLPNLTYGAAPFNVSATASSGLPVSFAVTGGPASLTGNTVTVLGAGNVSIQATQGGNGTYNAAPPVTQPFTVFPLPVGLTGSRAYDTNNDAASSILSITNILGSDNVNLASGSAVLASASVGVEPITGPGTLALGGTAATNYTVTGLTGSVTISNNFAPFSITSATLQGTNLVLCWGSVPGVTYNILTNGDLTTSNWTDIGGPLSPTGPVPTNTYCVTLPGATNTNLYFLIKQN